MPQEDRRSGAKRLNDLIAAAHDEWGTAPIFAEHAGLLAEIVSRVSIAGNGRDVRFLSTEVTELAVRVTAFFDGTVIDASFKEGALIVDVIPLIVASLRITSTEDLLSDDARVDPERPLAVNVTLDEGRTLTLRGSGTDDDPLTAYLSHLLELATAS